ncbi:MAG: CRISPR-associated endoribonuclease Cas2 1 [Turneriella sp.]|nr:CRISPR-associated endoribonuclease Cas2 1 [Turneriella sp.]
MQTHLEVIICYDVSVTRRRTKLFKRLKAFGLTDIQKSIFWGRLLPAEILAVRRVFDELLDKETDKAFILNTHLAEQIKDRSFGMNPQFFEEKEYDVI